METRAKVWNIDGWNIDVIMTTRFEAKKDGESVVLAATTMEDIKKLIALRERGIQDGRTN